MLFSRPFRVLSVRATNAPQVRCARFQGNTAIPEEWKEVYPREWAVWRTVDRNGKGVISNADLRAMCRKFDSSRHANFLVKIMDPEGIGVTSFPRFCKSFDAITMVRNAARYRNWNRTYGLGVAGNVAGHMEQAGEATAFEKSAPAPQTPAAIFTFYAPHPHTVDATEEEILTRLEQFPVTNSVIFFPRFEGAGNVQVEPEMGLYVDIVYSADEQSVERLIPRRIAAFNDCSIRRLDGSEKLSEKKNWGPGSKGISLQSFRVNSISPGTLVDQLVLVSFIKRDGVVHQYSINAPAKSYLMFHEPLLEWIIHRINHQKHEDKWEEIFPQLVASDYPTSMWIALGAGEYTQWGASNFLQPKDECLVVVYDAQLFPHGPSIDLVEDLFLEKDAARGIVALHQTFV